MAVRRFQVHPDVQVPTHDYGMVPAVSRQLIDQAFLDGAALVANAGGVFTVICGRHPTDLPGEMLTTGLVCEWRDRTDAKPQPEAAVQVTMEPDASPDEAGVETEDNPDGMDLSALEEEDDSEVPEGVR